MREVRDDGARYVGPFASRLAAEPAVAALHEVVPLRQCTRRLSVRGRSAACALAEMGRCGAPCTGSQSVEDYAAVVAEAAAVLGGDAREVVAALRERMGLLAGQERFEDAGAVRDRMLHLVRAAARAQRLAPLAASPEIVAARRSADGGWEIVWSATAGWPVRRSAPRGADPMPYVEALRATGEVVAPGAGPLPAGTPEETEKVLRWLEAPGVRLVALEGEWTCPVHGAGAARARLEPLAAAPRDAVGFDDPPRRPVRRPVTAPALPGAAPVPLAVTAAG